jgi:hypothetical protein
VIFFNFFSYCMGAWGWEHGGGSMGMGVWGSESAYFQLFSMGMGT